MNPKKTAVLLIEFQNDFTTPNGALHGAVKPVMESSNMMKNTKKVVDAAHENGITVMHAPITFQAGYNEIAKHPYGILKGVVDSTAFVKGSWGADFSADMKPEGDDIVIEGKRGLDTFCSTNLDFILRSKGIENVVIAGFLTNCCVESTMRTAYEKGFNVFTLTDCTAATSQDEQDAAVKFTYPMFSKPITSDNFIEMAHGEVAVADTSRGY